jgi:hypothetical protein
VNIPSFAILFMFSFVLGSLSGTLSFLSGGASSKIEFPRSAFRQTKTSLWAITGSFTLSQMLDLLVC